MPWRKTETSSLANLLVVAIQLYLKDTRKVFLLLKLSSPSDSLIVQEWSTILAFNTLISMILNAVSEVARPEMDVTKMIYPQAQALFFDISRLSCQSNNMHDGFWCNMQSFGEGGPYKWAPHARLVADIKPGFMECWCFDFDFLLQSMVIFLLTSGGLLRTCAGVGLFHIPLNTKVSHSHHE